MIRVNLIGEHAPTKRARPRRSRPRKASLQQRRFTRAVLEAGWREVGPYPADVERPRTRGECPTERPCPFVSCKHHLYLDVNPETGTLTINYPELEPWQLVQTCALDVADAGGCTLDEVGGHMNLTRERVRQMEVRALQVLRVLDVIKEAA